MKLLLIHPAGRQFQLKELYDPQPLFEANAHLADPPVGEIMKRIFSSFTAKAISNEAIDKVVTASCAETTILIPI